MGCPTSPQNRLETCLQQADPLKMSVKQFEVLPKPVLVGLPFAPTVDGNFLPDEVEVGVCLWVVFFVCFCFFFWLGVEMGLALLTPNVAIL